MCDGIDNYIRKLDDKPEYISTGLKVLDNNLHLVPGNFVVIGGRPSAGKTALSLQLACEIAKNGRKVAYFSLVDRPAPKMRSRSIMAASVMAAGSVMKEPSKGMKESATK